VFYCRLRGQLHVEADHLDGKLLPSRSRIHQSRNRRNSRGRTVDIMTWEQRQEYGCYRGVRHVVMTRRLRLRNLGLFQNSQYCDLTTSASVRQHITVIQVYS
jgi:hypothetical protein